MKITIGQLRALIREAVSAWGGGDPDGTLEDDVELKKKSVYVPDDIKTRISKWSKAMGMSSHKKKR